MLIKSNPIYSYISNILPELNLKLDNALAFDIKGWRYQARLRTLVAQGLWDGKTHLYNRNSGKFPTGLLGIVQNIVGFDPSHDKLEDGRFPKDYSFGDAIARAKTLELNGISLSGAQRAAIVGNVTAGRGLDLLATNAGKSEVVIGTALAINRKCLWLVMRKDLLRQCADRFETRTGLKAGMVGDGKFEVGELVTVAMVQSINPKELRWKSFLKQFEVLMLDEASHAQSKSWQAIANNCLAPFRFSLTGSMPKEPLMAHKIMAVSSSVVSAKVSNEQLIEVGWSAKPTIHIRPVQYPKNRLDYAEAYASMVQSHEGYLQVVVNDIIEWHKKGRSILVIVDRIHQGSRLSQELGGRGIDTIFLSGKHDGEYRKKILDKFRAGKLPVLIGSGILQEGIDLPAVEVLILAAGGKSAGRQLQRIGRALRKKKDADNNFVDIIDYALLGNDYMESHSAERMELYSDEGFKVVMMDEVKVGEK